MRALNGKPDVHEISSVEEEFAQWVQCIRCNKWRDLLDSECIYKVKRAT